MIDLASTSLPFASATLPPCVEHAITHGPADYEVLDWVLILARFWKGLEADEETVARDIEEWYTSSDAIEDLDREDIVRLVKGVYLFDRSRADCSEMYRVKSFQNGCARADCSFYNPPEAKDDVAMPSLEMTEVRQKPYAQPVNVASLAEQLVRNMNIKRLPGGLLAVYNRGVYVTEDAEITIDCVVRSYLQSELTTKLRSNLFLHVRALADSVSWDDFERFPHLLCCPNCVVDLQTLQILDHSPHYMQLHKTAVNYKPRAPRELWTKTLAEIMPVVNLSATGLENWEDQLDYFQTLWGYSITGETRDEIFVIHQGAGGCGKNTITWPIQGALGSYVQQVDPNILAAKGDYFRPDYELATGVGKRIFLTNESKEGARLNGQLIKAIATEGAVFNARQIRERPFSYILRAKAHLVMNPPPIIDEQDKAIERRLHYIQYQADFTDRPDLTLKTRLRSRSEAEGVLAWLIEGAHRYYQNGLHRSEAVSKAVKSLMDEGDPLYGFVDATLEPFPGEKVNSEGLIRAFKTHCNALLVNTDKIDPRGFGRMLNAQIKLRGWKVRTYRSNGRTIYQGMRYNAINEGGFS